MTTTGIGLVARPQSQISKKLLQRAVTTIRSIGFRVLIERETLEAYPDVSGDDVFSLESNPPSRIVVIGGDGTLLRVGLRLGARSGDVVLMAVRAGKRGFLMDVGPEELEPALRDFVEGRLQVISHSRLRSSLRGEQLPCVLNDVVVFTREGTLVRLDVYQGSERVMGVDGDGIIVSTTTGSTAYSLNAGGPIIDPKLDVMILTPLNPVQLFLRSVVLSSNEEINLRLRPDSGPALLILDGQLKYLVEAGDTISIGQCKEPLRVARRYWWSGYYERLYARLLSYW